MSLRIDRGKHGLPSLFHVNDGYFFLCYRTVGITAYLRCKDFKLGCPVRARLIGENFESDDVLHNHGPNLQYIPYLEERRTILGEAKRLDVATLQDIFDNRRIESNNLTYHSLFPAMLRARLDVLPKPHSLSDLISVLENDAYKCVSATSNFNEVLFKDFCTLPNGSSVILFMSQECASFLQTAPNVCVVHSLIGEVYNLLTIATLSDKRVVCLSYILMDGSGSTEFNAAFYLLKTHLISWNFLKGISTGPGPIGSSFKNILGVSLFPTLFDLMKDAKLCVQDEEQMMQSPEGTYVFGLCFALPLLPLDILPAGIALINQVSNQMQVRCGALFSFMEMQMQTPHFSLCGHMERTHFGVEGLKDDQERFFSNFDGDLYKITRYIVRSSEAAFKEIFEIRRGQGAALRSSSRQPASLFCDDTTQKLFRDILHPPLSLQIAVRNFMNAIVNKLRPFL